MLLRSDDGDFLFGSTVMTAEKGGRINLALKFGNLPSTRFEVGRRAVNSVWCVVYYYWRLAKGSWNTHVWNESS